MENNLESLIEKIPRNGMSRKCQNKLSLIAGQYFNKKPANQLKKELSHIHKGFVDEIYKRLNWVIKTESLNKICGIMGRHPEDCKKDSEFADMVITYCINYSPPKSKLKKEIFKIFDYLDEESKTNLYKRYKKGDKLNILNELKILANTQNFYVLITDKILGEK